MAIASHLQSISAPDERALLLYPSGLDFVVSFFAAGIIAVPAYPPKRNQKLSRLQAIVRDAQASLLLTTADIFSLIEKQAYSEQQILAISADVSQWEQVEKAIAKAITDLQEQD
ncbi:hypothetical protein [Nostoc sp. MG11]|uniref:hypothetical protein n=1 Tax=Nostoc sp. MG11 TaxID=2721166 RepID=UPI001D009AC2|nr:hypothetical protein [Nostoc sp. MG11]